MSLHSPFLAHTHEIWHLWSNCCNHAVVFLQGAERKMRDEERKRSKRRGKNDANSECCEDHFLHYALQDLVFRMCSNIEELPAFLPANKSLVSSSMGSDCTFFQTLDDHVTQPVLFIPETHLSSLQRMVSPSFTVYPSSRLLSCMNHVPDP